ncbi:MAG: GNAT family N-acetyltransferase [Chloroflexi bacterium]|nr:GNAT family N-acetyltransferase [Chloroflexota bacterium]
MIVAFLPAARFDAAQLADVINASYAAHPFPVHFSPRHYETFVRVHDIDQRLSVAAVCKDELVGLVQLGRRGDQGWVAALGVRPQYRRRGIGRGLMELVTQRARDAGLKRLRLEALQQSESAIRLHLNLGWRIERELLVWRRPAEQGYLPIPRELLAPIEPRAFLAISRSWRDQPPCWQREQTALEHFADRGMLGWAIVREGRPVAGVLTFPPRHEEMMLMDVAVEPEIGIRSAGRPLIQALHLKFPGVATVLNNEPVDSFLNPLFAAMQYRVIARRYEMIRDLRE